METDIKDLPVIRKNNFEKSEVTTKSPSACCIPKDNAAVCCTPNENKGDSSAPCCDQPEDGSPCCNK